MTIRKTTKWAVILLLLAAVGGGGYAFLLWNESNERIRQGILAKCAETVPEWDVTLGRARFDWDRRIHLYDFTLRARGQPQQIVSIPEIVVSIDRDEFAKNQELDVQKIRILGPVLDLIRDAHGKWNWQQLEKPPHSDQALPELEIVQATVRVRLEQSDGSPAATLGMQNANLKLIPSGKRRFLIQGLTQVSDAGKLTIDGSWDIEQGVGWFNGEMKDVASSGELSGLVIGSSPDLRLKLARAQTAMNNYVGSLPDEPGRTAFSGRHIENDGLQRTADNSSSSDPFLLTSSRVERSASQPSREPSAQDDGVPNLGASGNVDVKFRVAVKEPQTEPEFQFNIDIKQGQIENEILPFPLRDLKGRIDWNNDRLVLTGMTAQNGTTLVTLSGRFDRQGDVAPGRLDVAIENLALDDRLRGRLPAGPRKVYDSVNPGGTADFVGTLLFDGKGAWQPRDVLVTFRNCTGRHVKFPYPVQNISGTVKQHGGEFIANLTGQAGGHPATLSARIRGLDPGAELYFVLHADRLPVDDTFISACRPQLQKTIESLQVEGNIAADMTIYRPPGPDQPSTVNISGRLTHGSLEFVHFPYRLANLQGDVRYSSSNQTWLFENLSADHGKARITAFGSFIKQQEPGLLRLSLTARNADIDRQLEQALPESLQKVWQQTSPGGKLDLVTDIHWIPGLPAVITIPDGKVTAGELNLSAFQYPLDGVELGFSYADSQVKLKSFKGKHDRAQVSAQGQIDWTDQGDWRVRLTELIVDDLVPDRLFRRVLPADLRTVVEEIDPAGPISLDGMVEFRGTNGPQDPVTAAWDVETIHSGGKLKTGIELKNVYGRLTARGTWDGERVVMQGGIDLDSVEVWGYQFTHVLGPYSINGSQVIVGSRDIIFPDERNRRPVLSEERITARAIGGVFTFDAAVALLEEPTYRAKITMSQGRLEQYARRYMSDAKNLAGVMDGWIDVSGRGSSQDRITGRGQLRINPAALYELPVIVQVANLVGPPDKTAFRYALLDFNIADSQFLFNTIDLVGDTLSLRGRGAAWFDGKLNLDFYSMLPQNNFRIPLVSFVVGEATKGWVGVKVRGTTAVPTAKIVAAPQVDEALKNFLEAFGTGPQNSLPRLVIPPLVLPQPNGPRTQPPQTPRRNR